MWIGYSSSLYVSAVKDFFIDVQNKICLGFGIYEMPVFYFYV